MRVFITGATGLIGSAVTRNLVAHGHTVYALTRSDNSHAKLARMGASPIRGDITHPENWCPHLPDLDAVIHAACDYSDQMMQIDAHLLDHLIPALHRMPGHIRFIYTGGSWLYPATATQNIIGDETTAFDPVSEFQWMLPSIARILNDEKLHGMVIHPGSVYDTSPDAHGGVLARNIDTAITQNRVTVVGDETVKQAMVHADDLADLYDLALENAAAGSSYIGVGIDAVPTIELARDIADHFAKPDCQIETITTTEAMERYGDWARGLAHSQSLSSAKAIRELGWSPEHTDIATDIATYAKNIGKIGA